jgi:hypothetical protein
MRTKPAVSLAITAGILLWTVSWSEVENPLPARPPMHLTDQQAF